MKKLYRKGAVHPSPPNKLDQLTFLPAAILTLAAALSPEEKEVLAYLISCSNSSGNSFSNQHQRHRLSHQSGSSSSFARTNTTGTGSADHPPSFKCDCFRCYMSYWARWDSSPNRQLIHEIIEAFEEWLVQSSNSSKKSRKDRKKKGSDSNSNRNKSSELKRSETSQKNELSESDLVIESISSGVEGGGGSNIGGDEGEGEGEEKGSVRKLMNFIGERIWGVWGSSI
ncbi:uncharacterized protein LOC120005584 isoform X1 [Tripterygium wilfordii]|uniref:uncharacterized protein LOC120005584 isoform X1 n=1 Tax=Tripterygium wilfordii TaxID=458696 RepID=UPI0018F7F291|nr:uncharacterized protein LOC120005584 isoform X1 [Tripterygium wilfordii]XP_038711240.1 uncharacterized protein LOC120005584 isoform X1 [Tripterygium wilfordii]